jgi:phage gp29-like protein
MTVMELDGGPDVRNLERMLRNDAHAFQLATAMKLPIRTSTYEFIATEGDSGEKDFVEWALTAAYRQGGMTTPFRQIVSQMANAMVFRFQPFEKVWKVQDTGKYQGKVMLHKLGWRPPATCKLRTDDNGSFNGFQQDAYKGNKYIKHNFDPKRAFVFVHGSEWNPILGQTPFDTVYKNYLNKIKVSFFYFAFLENVAFPRTLVKVAGDDGTELQHLLNKARMLAHNGILGLYEHESIESYESQRNTRDYQSALEWLNWEMSRACLGQFLDLGTSGERGSYALSRDKSSFFFNQLEAVLKDMADAINNYLIADLVQYNFGKDAAYPKIRFRPLNDESAEAVLETYKSILMANTPQVTPDFMLQLVART